jgi:hypothetical protein
MRGEIYSSAAEGINLKIKVPREIFGSTKHEVGNLGYCIMRKQVT